MTASSAERTVPSGVHTAPSGEHRAEPKSAWWAEDDLVATLNFGLAVTASDFDGAFRLLHEQYLWRAYMTPAPSRRRLSLHNVLPTTKVFVARAGDAVVATVTVVEDSRLGLPIDEALGAELGRLRERGRRIGEAGALAVAAGYRASGVPILVRLYRMAVLYAAAIARLDDLAFVVHPRHLEFYRTLFPMREFEGTRRYRRLDGAPVIGLRLDLHLVRALIRVERAGFSATPLLNFVFGPESYREVTARLRRDLPRSGRTPPEWARLCADASRQEKAHADLATAELAEKADADLATAEVAAVVGAMFTAPPGGEP